jgi:long-chain acyl-CoA synthetase
LESLVEFVSKYAALGDEIAIRHRRGYRMESWGYKRIAAAANGLARELEDRGIRKGDAVLLWSESSAEWVVAFLGCLLLGAVAVPLDFASTVEFANRVSREVNAKLAFCGHAQIEGLPVPFISLESLREIAAERDPSPYRSPSLSRQDTLEIIFTSGTTAEPKGVVISHGNVLANIEPLEREVREYLRYEKLVHPIRFLNLLPLSHVFGQMLGVFIPPMLAGTVVFIDSVRPSDVMSSIQKEKISVLVAVPRFIESLQREVEREQEHTGSSDEFRESLQLADREHFLRRWWRFRKIRTKFGWKFWAFISGGAALPEQAETFWNRLGYAVIQGYGMTETTSLISLNHPFRAAKGSIGKVFPGMEVRVDQNGEILVRGENIATAYRYRGESQALPEADGWFRTGDIGETDEDGRLYFKGRRKNTIVTSAGMNVHPEDLEKELLAQPEVRDCVVIGLERSGNAEPCAVLLMREPSASPALAVETANKSLAEYQKIRHWFLWPEPDFPRTPTQKPILPRIREVINNSSSSAQERAPNGTSLAALISQITGRPVSLDSKSTTLEADLHLTSLDRVELMSALEQRYQTDLDEVPFQEIATIGQLEGLLARGPSSAAWHVYPTWPQNWLVTAFRLAVYYSLAWPATYLLAAPHVRGRENLRGLRGPALFISNHVTYLDIAWILPALPARFRNRLATAMGGERLARMRCPSSDLRLSERLFERLRYALVCSLFNVFPLPRESGFLTSFSFVGNLADRGWNVLVFPEGQTTEHGHMIPFRSGIGLLARHLNIPVVPIRLDGLFDLQQAKRIFAWPGHVRVTIGPPVHFSPHQDAKEIASELEKRVRELQSV